MSSDWDTVTYLHKKPPKASQLRSQQAINTARRQGIPIETTKKITPANKKVVANAAKLDQETEQLHHDTVGLDVGRLIQQGRQSKNLTQKDLATKICEKPQVVNDYEAGRAIPNQQILSKIERAIGIKLRGKDKGQPLEFKGKKK